MKVKELIEYLQTLDQERGICIVFGDYLPLSDFSNLTWVEADKDSAEDYGINVGDYLTYIG